MTRMAGSVRTTRMALTMGLRLPLGMLGCSETGRSWPDVLMMSPEGAATLALRVDRDTISRSPAPGSPSPAARRYLSLRQGPGRSPAHAGSCPVRCWPSFIGRPGAFDGMPDGQSGGGSGRATRALTNGAVRGRQSERGEPVKATPEFVLASWPTSGDIRPVAVIVRGGAVVPHGAARRPGSKAWPARTPTLTPTLVGR